ncbi:FAD binding domain-containing protein [Romboutsia sp.]|uniref:FAD binding domain-containing protein n=1 Tax=Romboutsia sp. TaxID=1965302 RepID=UPI002D02976D|nr:FAD binding domain-containing protein [Romboutsia sp.]HSQ90447.1 FAD binding domain-containing protein [Romboutsia sp.]
MFSIKEVYRPTSIEDAYKTLISQKNNVILGGTLFLRMGNKRINKALDLTSLNLSYISEEKEYIEIGAMTSLRELETNKIIINNFKEVSECVKDIIGVQFRNIATIGGSVFSKYGFSDVIVALLSYNTEVELYNGGRIKLEEFLRQPYKKDLLTKIYIYKDNIKAKYISIRNESSDYPILNVSISNNSGQFKICIGARPQRATIAIEASQYISSNPKTLENIIKAAEIASEELVFGSNTRGNSEYRKKIAKVLVKRAILEVEKC